MAAQKKEKPEKNIATLVDLEWKIINKLSSKLEDQDLTTHEFAITSRALALHVSNLRKLMDKFEGTTGSDEQSLGEYIIGVTPKIIRQGRNPRSWKKRLSFRR
jgi:hypothetical protein